MLIVKQVEATRTQLEKLRKKYGALSFVPTMGALHEGHLSLIDFALSESDHTVSSIFVNPRQFNDPADFQKYPITTEEDLQLLLKSGCDLLFLPSVTEIYPDAGRIAPHVYELGHLDNILEGRHRPGHFQGVCQVMQRLLDIVQPDRLYLGQKDYQQCLVIKRLVLMLGLSTKVIICPTLREASGLAMSSRNRRLSEEQKNKATAIFRSLQLIVHEIRPGNQQALLERAVAIQEEAGLRTEYCALATASDLTLVDHWDGRETLVALTAAYMDEVRLIDNYLLSGDERYFS